MEQDSGTVEDYRTTFYNYVGTVENAHRTAEQYLARRLPQRWLHVQGVAAKAAELADGLDLSEADKALLVVAAWYHDIGYALTENGYGWHPLDGALMLRGWELDLVADQVAWHTTAAEEAKTLGLMNTLEGYTRPVGLVADALTYADMTTGPDGQEMTFEQRLAEVRTRHGSDSDAVKAMEAAWPRLLKLRDRVDEAIRKHHALSAAGQGQAGAASTPTAAVRELPGEVTVYEGPGGSTVYYLAGRPWLARCPVADLDEAEEFLEAFGVSVRVDLRDQECEDDLGAVTVSWPCVLLPLAPLDPGPLEGRNRQWVYVRRVEDIAAAARVVDGLLQEGHVPLVHCRVAADRTGTVVATLLARVTGDEAAALDFAAASAHCSHPRKVSEIADFLNLVHRFE